MRRMIFGSVARLTEDPVEIFWLAGFVMNEDNEWKIRVVYRNKRTQEIIQRYESIGMLPILGLGIWFDYGVLKTDELPGQMLEMVIPDVGNPEIITSADIPEALNPLPKGKAGRQRLFRYKTGSGTVLIPVVELIRALFIHNRALALALMRPAGLEQLYIPMAPGWNSSVYIRFTREISKSTLSRELAMEFAWLVLDRQARRSWDSVRRLSNKQDYVLFDPPAIKNSTWSFRGIKHEDQHLVLELIHVGGRYVPTEQLTYTHPGLKRVVSVRAPGEQSGNSQGKGARSEQKKGDINVDDGEAGSGAYRSALVVDGSRRNSLFENKILVSKAEKIHRKYGECPNFCVNGV